MTRRGFFGLIGLTIGSLLVAKKVGTGFVYIDEYKDVLIHDGNVGSISDIRDYGNLQSYQKDIAYQMGIDLGKKMDKTIMNVIMKG